MFRQLVWLCDLTYVLDIPVTYANVPVGLKSSVVGLVVILVCGWLHGLVLHLLKRGGSRDLRRCACWCPVWWWLVSCSWFVLKKVCYYVLARCFGESQDPRQR